MEYRQILVKEEGAVCIITLNDPDNLNALNQDMLNELDHAIKEIKSETHIRSVVITGSGKVFSAGGDIRRMERRFEEPPPLARNRIKNFQSLILAIREIEKPVIASINGPAVGAGCSLALACDLRIASERARFGLTHVRLGLVPDGGGMYFLPRLVGTARALELLLSGEIIDAQRAEGIGLVNRVVPHDELPVLSMKWAQDISKGPPHAMGIIKSVVYRGLHIDLPTELELEAALIPICLKTEDHIEGVKAFIDKRTPQFQGR